MNFIFITVGNNVYSFTKEMLEKVKTLNDMVSDLGSDNIELDLDPLEFDLLYKKLTDTDDILFPLIRIANQLEVNEILDEIYTAIKEYPISELLDNYKYFKGTIMEKRLLNEITVNIMKYPICELIANYDKYKNIEYLKLKIGIYLFLNNNNEEWTRNEFMKEMEKRYPSVEIDPDANLVECIDTPGFNEKITMIGDNKSIKKIKIYRKHKGVSQKFETGSIRKFFGGTERSIGHKVHIITHNDIYYNLIYDFLPFIDDFPVTSSYKLNTEMFLDILLRRDIKLIKGDMIYIPFYDNSTSNYRHCIDRFILIYNGNKLVYPEHNHGITYPGSEFPFTEFSIEHFEIFKIPLFMRRIVDNNFIKWYNQSSTKIITSGKMTYSFKYKGDKLEMNKSYYIDIDYGLSNPSLIHRRIDFSICQI